MKPIPLPDTWVHRLLRRIAACTPFWRLWQATVGRCHDRLQRHRSWACEAAYRRDLGLPAAVRGGPFTGLLYPVLRSAGSALLPKLTGSYESELHRILAGVIARAPALVVDVGSAEGYYAVGLARANPGTRVIAFDPDPEAAALCAELARANGVSEFVQQRGACRPEDLLALPPMAGAFLLCDCEGWEQELFTAATAASLAQAELVIECHQHAAPAVSRQLIALFAATHAITVIPGKDDDQRAAAGRTAVCPGETEAVRKVLVSEWRPVPQFWLHLVPRAAPPS